MNKKSNSAAETTCKLTHPKGLEMVKLLYDGVEVKDIDKALRVSKGVSKKWVINGEAILESGHGENWDSGSSGLQPREVRYVVVALVVAYQNLKKCREEDYSSQVRVLVREWEVVLQESGLSFEDLMEFEEFREEYQELLEELKERYPYESLSLEEWFGVQKSKITGFDLKYVKDYYMKCCENIRILERRRENRQETGWKRTGEEETGGLVCWNSLEEKSGCGGKGLEKKCCSNCGTAVMCQDVG